MCPAALVAESLPRRRPRWGFAGRTIAIAGLEATITDVLVRIHNAAGRLGSHLVPPATPSVSPSA